MKYTLNSYDNVLKKLNLNTLEDLLTYYPYRYEVIKLATLNDCINTKGTLNVIVYSSPIINYIRKGLNRLSFKCLYNGTFINVSIFNRAYLKRNLIPGANISITGTYDYLHNNFTATDISLEVITNTMIKPIYHLKSGVTNKYITNTISKLIDNYNIKDYIPEYFNNKYKLISKKDALLNIHFPKSIKELKQAQLKLIYEEFFIFTFKINYLRILRTKEKGILRNVSFDKVEDFIKTLPFTLTKDQLNTTKDIYKDMISNNRMNRLILGDVGSGKTVCSINAIVINYYSRYQSALMVPTEVLARQHYDTIRSLAPFIKTALLVGSTPLKEKNNILKKLASGEIDCIVGTHSLLNDKVIFNNLGLIITDEQHRFGVNQRKSLSDKGGLADIIYMSATPIPRTYALSLYGDMDISIIKTKPNGRKDVITKILLESDIKQALDTTYQELKNNHQVYVVSPSIEETENLSDVKTLEKKFNTAFGIKYKIGILHGKMKKEDKNNIIDNFKKGNIKILISTTVIEVGVDVSNATVMLIYNANLFGLATLHQLRGRVGRNNYTCYCYLISKVDEERLHVLEESNDGFYISKRDFEMRGEGDLFGEKQSGDMVFKIGNIKKDTKILMQCSSDSAYYIEHFDNNSYYKDIMATLHNQN